MSKLWSSFVSGLDPYVPGEQPKEQGVIKLNTNENPYPPSPSVIEAIKSAADDTLRLYPDPESDQLRSVIAEYHDTGNLSANNVFIGNGSDEVLAHSFNAFFRRGAPVLYPDISYSFYPVYCQLYAIPGKAIPLDDKYEIDSALYANNKEGELSGIVFANPNAPTGVLLTLSSIRSILNDNPGVVVVVDEAYIDFAGDEKAASAISLVNEYPNLLVTRTLSKSRALAGIRLGYAVGHAGLIEALDRVKNSFNSYPVDRLSEAAALASFDDEAYFQDRRNAVIEQRKFLNVELSTLGFSCLPSAANFIMATHNKLSAEVLAQELRFKNIVVRYFNKPRLSRYLRISVGDENQNASLIEALTVIVSQFK